MDISEVTRRDIIDYLVATNQIEGRLGITEFLRKVWPIHNMISPYSKSGTVTYEQEITRHMINFNDWDYEFLLYDSLQILECSDEIFIKFLETCVHPTVHSNQEYIAKLVSIFNNSLKQDGYVLEVASYLSGKPVFKVLKYIERKSGVKGNVKNLIFAANGPKPEIILIDSVNNDIQIVENEQYCLVYDKPILDRGLLWIDLIDWWREQKVLVSLEGKEQEIQLYQRLFASLSSKPEKLLFRTYFEQFKPILGDSLPALVPQVYLHYDQKTVSQLPKGQRLVRQRMDFLLLFSNCDRIVLEVDGKQHYSDNDIASPSLYANMVAADRRLRLAGYEIYRFGGYELYGEPGKRVVTDFFHALFQRHSIERERITQAQ